MKRLFSLLLACIIMATCATSALAANITDAPLEEATETEMARFRELIEEARMLDYFAPENTSAPVLSVHRTDTEYYITNTYYPSSIIEFFTTKDPELAKKLVMWISYDIRFDDSDWLLTGKNDVEIYGQFSTIFNHTVTYDSLITEPVTNVVLNLSEYDPSLEMGAFAEYITIENDRAYIDLTKHTVEIKQSCIIYCGTYPCQMQYSQSSALRELTEETAPTTIAPPTINGLTAGQDLAQISFRLQGDAIVSGLQNLNHECYLEVRYKIGDSKWSQFAQYPINPATFTVIDEPNLKNATPHTVQRQGEIVTIECRYYDKTANIYSDVTVAETEVRKNGNSHATTNLPSFVDTQTAYQCSVCGTCNQPLSMCIWFFIPSIALFSIAVIALIACILTRKDKSLCPSKNSKTHK